MDATYYFTGVLLTLLSIKLMILSGNQNLLLTVVLIGLTVWPVHLDQPIWN